MPIEFIPTRTDQNKYPDVQELIIALQKNSAHLGIDDGVMYYGWPKFQDYDSIGHPVDLALLSKKTGLILLRYEGGSIRSQYELAEESISQASATAEAQMMKSATLRNRRRKLVFEVSPLVYAPNYNGDYHEIDFLKSEAEILEYISDFKDQNIPSLLLEEARSILEGAKALGRPQRRIVDDGDKCPAAWALSQLEEQIAKFDAQQRSVALTNLRSPQRIRGLAGSGKTIILAMKAALAHIEDPSSNILVTYYTRSLRDHLTRMITRFYRHFGEGEPNWKKLHVQHGWGQQGLPGVYRETCLRSEVSPISFGMAKNQRNPFDFVCKDLLESGRVKPFYDMILIDEGQDFPEGFFDYALSSQKVLEIKNKLFGHMMNFKIFLMSM